MLDRTRPSPRGSDRPKRFRNPGAIAIITAIVALAGVTVLCYPWAASWVSDFNQSAIVNNYDSSLAHVDPDRRKQLAAAHAYNEALSSGAMITAGERVPRGDGVAPDGDADYWKLLVTPDDGPMARIQIPKIHVDLPVFHGTSDQTLLQGVGHLEGTSLPVGGRSTHAVLTGHRGLVDATMFTDLDKLSVGDDFVISVFGETLTYRVIDSRVVDPKATESLRQVAGKDLVTLVTCTPLGINTHRILVTGERVTPTPQKYERSAKAPSEAGFPWWAVVYLAALSLIGRYVWWASSVPGSARDRRRGGTRFPRARRSTFSTEWRP